MATTPTEQKNEVSIAAMRVEIEYLKLAVAQSNSKLDDVLRQLNEAKGGWRVLMMVGGAAGIIGSGVSWAISHWKP